VFHREKTDCGREVFTDLSALFVLEAVLTRLDALERDRTPDRRLLLGHVDRAEAACANLLQPAPKEAAAVICRRFDGVPGKTVG
jgi:hypothetical protein